MLCKILKSFAGSQDGRFSENFEAGTTADLSDYLMAAADPSWFARAEQKPEDADQESKAPPVVENKAINTDGKSGKGKAK